MIESSRLTGEAPGRIAASAGVLIASVMLVLTGVQPILAGLYVGHLHLSLGSVGWVLTAEQIGALGGGLLGFQLATKLSWSVTILAACVIAIGATVATALCAGFTGLWLARFGSGLGTMLGYTIAIYFLGFVRPPDNAFGAVMVLQTVFIAVGSVIVPRLSGAYGYATAVLSGIVWLAVAAPAALALPKGTSHAHASAPHPGGPSPNRIVGVAALAGLFLLVLSVFSVWGFLERIGLASGLSDDRIGYALGLGSLGGLIGGGIPMAIGARLGRVSMTIAATVLVVGSFIGLTHPHGWAWYAACVLALNTGLILGLTYYMGLAVQHDSDGRLTRLLPFTQALGASAGPACSALAVAGGRLGMIFAIACAAAIAASVITVGGAAWRNPQVLRN